MMTSNERVASPRTASQQNPPRTDARSWSPSTEEHVGRATNEGGLHRRAFPKNGRSLSSPRLVRDRVPTRRPLLFALLAALALVGAALGAVWAVATAEARASALLDL